MNRDPYFKYSVYSAKSLSQRAIFKVKKSKKAVSGNGQSASTPSLRNGTVSNRRTTSATASTRLMNRNVNAGNSSNPSMASSKKSSSNKRFNVDVKVSKSGSLPVNASHSNEQTHSAGKTRPQDPSGKSDSKESIGKNSNEDEFDFTLNNNEKKAPKTRNSRMRGQPFEETIPEQSQEPIVIRQSERGLEEPTAIDTDFYDEELALEEEPIPEIKNLGKSESRRGYRSSSTALFDISKGSSVRPEEEDLVEEESGEEDGKHAIVMGPFTTEELPRSDIPPSTTEHDDLYMLPPSSEMSDSPRVEISADHESTDDIHKRIDELKKGISESAKAPSPVFSPQVSRTRIIDKNPVSESGMDAAWPTPVDSRRPSSVAVPMPQLAESIVEEGEAEDREQRTTKPNKTGFELMGLEPSPVAKVMSQSGKVHNQAMLETSLSSPVLDQKQRPNKSRSKIPDHHHQQSGEDNLKPNRKIAEGGHLTHSIMGSKRLINISRSKDIHWLSELLDSKSHHHDHGKAAALPLENLDMDNIDLCMEESPSGVHVHVHLKKTDNTSAADKTGRTTDEKLTKSLNEGGKDKSCTEPLSGITSKIGDKKLRERIACLQGGKKMAPRKPRDGSPRKPPDVLELEGEIPTRPLPNWYEDSLNRSNVERHSENIMLLSDHADKETEIRRFTTDAVNEAPKPVTVVINANNPMEAHKTRSLMALRDEQEELDELDETGRSVAELDVWKLKDSASGKADMSPGELATKKKRRKTGKPQLSVLWTIFDAERDEIYLKGRPITDSLEFFKKIGGLTTTMTPLDRYVFACMIHHRRRELRYEERDDNGIPHLISYYIMAPLSHLMEKTRIGIKKCYEKYQSCMMTRRLSQQPWVSRFGGVPQCLCDAFAMSSLICKTTPSQTPQQRASEPGYQNTDNIPSHSDPIIQSTHEDTTPMPYSTHVGGTITPNASEMESS